ncbi:MAG: TonB family protein [Akkermansiaceae bacterium]|nr:TonB family protein [Akkermansiaceae bacterium]
MKAFLHSLNIGTLALWLSVVGFASVGEALDVWFPSPFTETTTHTLMAQDEVLLGVTSETETLTSEQRDTSSPDTAEKLTALPDMPESPSLGPLPTIPEIPSPSPTTAIVKPSSSSGSLASLPKQTTHPTSGNRTSSDSSSSRISNGRMPSPQYPAEAKRKNQTGTVTVEFTVDASGHVTSAHALSSSGWPLLDSEAVRAVRRWSFPAGKVITLQRPIVFQLR